MGSPRCEPGAQPVDADFAHEVGTVRSMRIGRLLCVMRVSHYLRGAEDGEHGPLIGRYGVARGVLCTADDDELEAHFESIDAAGAVGLEAALRPLDWMHSAEAGELVECMDAEYAGVRHDGPPEHAVAVPHVADPARVALVLQRRIVDPNAVVFYGEVEGMRFAHGVDHSPQTQRTHTTHRPIQLLAAVAGVRRHGDGDPAARRAVAAWVAALLAAGARVDGASGSPPPGRAPPPAPGADRIPTALEVMDERTRAWGWTAVEAAPTWHAFMAAPGGRSSEFAAAVGRVLAREPPNPAAAPLRAVFVAAAALRFAVRDRVPPDLVAEACAFLGLVRRPPPPRQKRTHT